MRVKQTKILYFTVGFILALLGVAQYWIFQSTAAKQLNQVYKQMKELDGMVKVDNLRTENINKVLSVLNRFNPSMSDEQKLAIASEICDASLKYANLDVDLLCATITHESAFSWDPQVVSHAGAMGLMQVMPETGKIIARIEGIQWTKADDVLFNPVLNIRLGSRYLSSLIELYDVDGGLAAYNGGGKRVELWLAHNKARGILYRETQYYVPAILSLYDEFRN
jgi:soluble lytic murein transglycosylase-like protein